MQIFTLAVDIKVPETGPIQILEIMPGHHAGQSGYKKLFPADPYASMTNDHIMPYLTTLHPEQRAECAWPQTDLFDLASATCGSFADAQDGILYPERSIGKNKYFQILARSEMVFLKHYPKITVVNGDQNFLLMQDNKAAIQLIIDETPALAPYFAASIILPARYDEDMAEDIQKKLGAHDYYVIKPVDQAQGNGVRIVAADALPDMLHDLLERKRRYKPQIPGRDFWLTDINPVFMVQPYISSHAVEKDGQSYDGTMRMFMTLHRENKDQDFAIKIHEGYWKLPARPLALTFNRASRISNSAGRTESVRFLSALFNRMSFGRLCKPSEILSAAVRSADQDRVRADLACALPPLMKALDDMPIASRLKNWLYSDDEIRQGVAAMLSTHEWYYIGSEEDPLPLNSQKFPASFSDRLVALAQNDINGPLAQYFVNIDNPDSYPKPLSRPSDIDWRVIQPIREHHKQYGLPAGDLITQLVRLSMLSLK